VDSPDRVPFGGVGKIDEEDLVEAPLAQQLGRERREVVRRRDGKGKIRLYVINKEKPRMKARQ